MIRCALQHAPTFVDGHGGHPERDVEGAVPYKGAVEMVRCHRRGEAGGGGGNFGTGDEKALPDGSSGRGILN